MQARDFIYWLQGVYEISPPTNGFTREQAQLIGQHLAMVFIHDIDPKAGDEKHQQELNQAHSGGKPTVKYRC